MAFDSLSDVEKQELVRDATRYRWLRANPSDLTDVSLDEFVDRCIEEDQDGKYCRE